MAIAKKKLGTLKSKTVSSGLVTIHVKKDCIESFVFVDSGKVVALGNVYQAAQGRQTRVVSWSTNKANTGSVVFACGSDANIALQSGAGFLLISKDTYVAHGKTSDDNPLIVLGDVNDDKYSLIWGVG